MQRSPTIPLSRFRRELNGYLKRAHGEAVVLTRNGAPVAVALPLELFKLMVELGRPAAEPNPPGVGAD